MGLARLSVLLVFERSSAAVLALAAVGDLNNNQSPSVLLNNQCCTLTTMPVGYDLTYKFNQESEDPARYSCNLYCLEVQRSISAANDNVLTATPMTEKEHGGVTANLELEQFLLTVNKPSRAKNSIQPEVAVDNNKHDAPIGTRLLLQDELVKIWEFSISPGDSCPYHRHQFPYLFLNLQVSVTQSLGPNGEPDATSPRMQQQDQVTFVPTQQLGAHGVLNVGDGLFQQFIVEFLQW